MSLQTFSQIYIYNNNIQNTLYNIILHKIRSLDLEELIWHFYII